MGKLKDNDYKIEKLSKEETEHIFDFPVNLKNIELSGSQKERIVEEAIKELDTLRQDRIERGWDDLWETVKQYYEGVEIQLDDEMMYNLHKFNMNVKVDTVVEDASKAFFESDPIFSIKPLPETASRKDIDVICYKKEDFLQYKWEQLPIQEQYTLCFHNAILLGTGWIKWVHKIDTFIDTKNYRYKPTITTLDEEGLLLMEKESFENANIVPIETLDEQTLRTLILSTDKNANIKILDRANAKLIDFTELKRFDENHRKIMVENGDINKYKRFIEDLKNGKEVAFKQQTRETSYNDAYPTFVETRDVWVDMNVRSYEELGAKNIYERTNFTFKELKKKEAEEEFYDVDKVKEGQEDSEDEDFNDNDPIDIIVCTGYVNIEDEENDLSKEKRIMFWFHEETKTMLGAILYPYEGVISPYVPHNIKKTLKGLYQHGLGVVLIDTNIADDNVMNFILEAAKRQNTDTPILEEGSSIIDQFVSRNFLDGVPLVKEPGESIDFMSNYRRNALDYQGLLALSQEIGRMQDDVSRVSSLRTGRESIADPNAPASKTFALLQQSGRGIEGYIKQLLPAFNRSADIMLQIYHQLTNENTHKYNLRPERIVPGGNPFGEITREEMVMRTNIESQALGFDFERNNFLNQMMTLLQILNKFPVFSNNPKAVYDYLRTITKAWHPMIRSKVDQILPKPEEYDADIRKMVAKTVLQIAKQQAQSENPVLDPNMLVNVVKQVLGDQAVPPTKEEMKAREQ